MYSINPIHFQKYIRLDQHLSQAGIDILVCMLPENIVYLTGTYPVHGVSVAIYIPGAGSLMLQPECEQYWVEPDQSTVSLFGWGHLGELPIEESYARFLSMVWRQYNLSGRRVGVELHYKSCAPAFRSAEMNLPDAAWVDIVRMNMPGCPIINCVPALESAKAIKFPFEIEKIRKANQIAQIGLTELGRNIQPGMTEVEAAALVENTIRVNGTGFDGARLVRGFAEVTSGPEGSLRQSMLIPASQRRFENGELVIIEMAVVADGYWSDLTRVYCAGKPDQEQKRIFNSVLKAQQAAAAELLDGKGFSAPDNASRKIITEAGLGEYFIHGSGHGVGWRYHESLPQLGPDSIGVLRTGMVTSVEPGVYIPGFGGFRIEDNLMVGDTEPEWLSSPVEPW